MKLLFVDASRNGWGTEQHLVALARALDANGHRVAAVVRANSPVARLLLDSAIRTYPTPFRGGADPRGILATLRAIRHEAPDWIVTSRVKLYWTVWCLARLTGVRVVLFRHMAELRPWLMRTLLPRLVDQFVVVSEFAREHLAARGAPHDRLRVLYNPIDIGPRRSLRSRRAVARLRLGVRADDCLVGFVGRVERQKGLGVLLTALQSLMHRSARLRFLCVGNGPELDWVRRQFDVAGLSDRCQFVAWTARLEDLYPAMDVLVAPSVIPETFCRVLAEAQASGVAVIGTRIGGVPEAFLPGQSGLLVAPNSCADLERAIARLLDDRQLRQRFADAGRRYVSERFESRRVAAQFVAMLDPRFPAAPAWQATPVSRMDAAAPGRTAAP